MNKHMKDIRAKGDAELEKHLVEAREKLRNERFSAAGARAKDPNAPRKFRRVIARVLAEQGARSRTAA